MKHPISVTITDAQTLTRFTLKHYLNSIQDIRVVLDTDTGIELLERLYHCTAKPHICLLEVCLPKLSGLQTLHKIKKEYGTEIKVIILSCYQSPHIIAKFLRNGASGFISKNESPDIFIDAIHHVHNGCVYYPEVLLRQVPKYISEPRCNTLTPREFEFLSLCATELGYKEIACRMNVSVRTIESYRDALFRKLQVKTRVGLAIYAINAGIFSFD